jgi:hypothetical protein
MTRAIAASYSLNSPVGSFVVEAFRASGLRLPHPTILAFPVEVRTSLLETADI